MPELTLCLIFVGYANVNFIYKAKTHKVASKDFTVCLRLPLSLLWFMTLFNVKYNASWQFYSWFITYIGELTSVKRAPSYHKVYKKTTNSLPVCWSLFPFRSLSALHPDIIELFVIPVSMATWAKSSCGQWGDGLRESAGKCLSVPAVIRVPFLP